MKLLKQLRFLIIYAVCVCLVLCTVYYFKWKDQLLVWAICIEIPVAMSVYISSALFGYRIQWKNNNSIFGIFKLSFLVYIIIFIAFGFQRFAFVHSYNQLIQEMLGNAKDALIYAGIFFIFSCFIKIIQRYLSNKKPTQQNHNNFDDLNFDLFK